jgi:hypothetical protein
MDPTKKEQAKRTLGDPMPRSFAPSTPMVRSIRVVLLQDSGSCPYTNARSVWKFSWSFDDLKLRYSKQIH